MRQNIYPVYVSIESPINLLLLKQIHVHFLLEMHKFKINNFQKQKILTEYLRYNKS